MSHVIYFLYSFLFSLEMITACVFFICLVFFVSLIYLQTLRQQNTSPFRNFKHISVSFCFCFWDRPSGALHGAPAAETALTASCEAVIPGSPFPAILPLPLWFVPLPVSHVIFLDYLTHSDEIHTPTASWDITGRWIRWDLAYMKRS